jgi:hypothetical protein
LAPEDGIIDEALQGGDDFLSGSAGRPGKEIRRDAVNERQPQVCRKVG